MQQNVPHANPLAAVPNLVELQLNSFQWFLDKGLRELFHQFSPIEDFTGNLSLDQEEADALKAKLEEQGATVEIK